MTNIEWIERFVAPAAKETQDRAQFWPEKGVGPFAAVLRLEADRVSVFMASGSEATREACQKLRQEGKIPLVILDYISAQEYGNQVMIAALGEIRDQAFEENVAIVGGESAEHNNMGPDDCFTVVFALGVAVK